MKSKKTLIFGVFIILILIPIAYFKIVDTNTIDIKSQDQEELQEEQETKKLSTIQDRRDALREVFK